MMRSGPPHHLNDVIEILRIYFSACVCRLSTQKYEFFENEICARELTIGENKSFS